MTFTLNYKNNPFYILSATPEDGLEVLAQKYKLVLAEADYEHSFTVGEAYQALCSSEERFKAELTWFADVDLEQAELLINEPNKPMFMTAQPVSNKSASKKSPRQKAASAKRYEPLVQMNLFAQINIGINRFIQHPGMSEYTYQQLMEEWLLAWQTFLNNKTLLKIINEQRSAADFSLIEPEPLEAALEELHSQQIKVLLPNIERFEQFTRWEEQTSRKSDRSKSGRIVNPEMIDPILLRGVSFYNNSMKGIEADLGERLDLLWLINNSEQKEALFHQLVNNIKQCGINLNQAFRIRSNNPSLFKEEFLNYGEKIAAIVLEKLSEERVQKVIPSVSDSDIYSNGAQEQGITKARNCKMVCELLEALKSFELWMSTDNSLKISALINNYRSAYYLTMVALYAPSFYRFNEEKLNKIQIAYLCKDALNGGFNSISTGMSLAGDAYGALIEALKNSEDGDVRAGIYTIAHQWCRENSFTFTINEIGGAILITLELKELLKQYPPSETYEKAFGFHNKFYLNRLCFKFLDHAKRNGLSNKLKAMANRLVNHLDVNAEVKEGFRDSFRIVPSIISGGVEVIPAHTPSQKNKKQTIIQVLVALGTASACLYLLLCA